MMSCCVDGRLRVRRLAAAGRRALAILLLGLALTPPAAADESLLSPNRWREDSYGLSLQPPLGSRIVAQTADDALAAIVVDDEYAIGIYIRGRNTDPEFYRRREAALEEPPEFEEDPALRRHVLEPAGAPEEQAEQWRPPLSVEELAAVAIRQLANAQPAARYLQEDESRFEAAGRQGVCVYFAINRPNERNKLDPSRAWVLGQALLQIEADHYVLLELNVAQDRFDSAKPVFEAVARSIELADPQALADRREALAVAGQAWREQINRAQLRAALAEEQWFRILEGERDIGYMRIVQKRDRQLEAPGLRVDVHSQMNVDGRAYGTQSNFFLSDDGLKEFWSIRMTERLDSRARGLRDARAPDAITWTETGVRSGEEIDIVRDGPEGKQTLEGERPRSSDGRPVPYVSQVELFLLERLLPGNEPRELGYYAYNANTGRISFRTERVVPQPDGSWKLYSRASPDQPEQVSTFDATGRLVSRTMASGHTLLPSTREEISGRNRVRQGLRE